MYGATRFGPVNKGLSGSGNSGHEYPGYAVIFVHPNCAVVFTGGLASPSEPNGFSIRPLNTEVLPENGGFSCARESALTLSKNTPYPPRTLVRPSPRTSQANPMRGAKLLRSASTSPRGTSPGKRTPRGASGTTFDCSPGWTVLIRSLRSTHGRNGSYLRPKVTINRRETLNWSWRYTECALVMVSVSRTPKLRFKLL